MSPSMAAFDRSPAPLEGEGVECHELRGSAATLKRDAANPSLKSTLHS